MGLRHAAVNKASGCNEIPTELFKSLKEDAIKVLHSLCQLIWKTQQWPQDWKNSILILITKKGSTKECVNHWIVALISHASKVILKILDGRLQYYENQGLPDTQAGFRKGRGTRDQITNIHWIVENKGISEKKKKSIPVPLTTLKPLTLYIMTNLGKLLERCKYQTILPVSWESCAGQEATARTLYRTTDWFKIKKGVWQCCLLSLFNL